jgi:rhamnogalacturonyl hydrolase YesR
MRKYVLMLLVSMLFGTRASAQYIWDAAHLQRVKASLQEPFYQEAYRHLAARADDLLTAQPLSVMMKPRTPASGNKHDYMSLARYFWPDPTKPDGLPYISHDGRSNPELKLLDRDRLGATAQRITTLSLAWYLSGEEKYARKATELIKVWFLNKETCMRPNLNYAQMVPGRNGGKGRMSGVLDGYSLVGVVDAVSLLQTSRSFTHRDQKQLRKWFADYLDWILTSKQGIDEGNTANNHSVVYDTQVLSVALFTGRTDVARKVVSELGDRRIFRQIEPDGRQPQELRRTLAFGYSQYNLSHLIDIFLMARHAHLAEDLSHTTSADGRNFYKAMDFLAQYVGRKVEAWPYRQISEWDYKQQELCKDLYRAGRYLDPSRTDYIDLFQKNRRLDFSDPFFLLYYEPSYRDNALVQAGHQLRFAIRTVKSEQKKPENLQKQLFAPRTVRQDGTLALVGIRDWCVGFFAGSLWQMYRYTKDSFWRQEAVSFTWPIEGAKNLTSTHDLGFMIGDSFGQAYELTGEQSYRDVVLTASRSLISRYNDRVGCIRSWDHNKDRWQFPVIIDNMMNLEMLFRATQLTGDSTYWHIAVRHADTTLRNHFREDGSSFHVVDYDPSTGSVRMRCTAQGESDDSFWSRGQAWGLYGYTLCYRFTRDTKYLRQAEKIARFILSLPIPDDHIPYWDMKSKDMPNTSRDASAAAITASALQELAGYVSADEADTYTRRADSILQHLVSGYQAAPDTHGGFLLLHSTGHHPAGSEIDVPLNYADYFYLEALQR